jgi:hypothetical protein
VNNRNYATEYDLKNIDYSTINNVPVSEDETGELNITDESGNIGMKVASEAVYAKDFVAGEHKLSEKVDKTYVDNLELDELNAVLVDTDSVADDPIVPDYVTESELETALSSKMDKVTLAKVANSGNYNDLTNKPTIPTAVTESTVSGWGFTKNTGTYSKPSGGIPKTDLANAVQTSLGKADTALQSYTEQYKGTITGVSANGKSVATSGVANIPAASTSAYGVTKLNSSTSSTSTTEAATASAVKAAYDLANSYKGTVTGVKINGTTKSPTSGIVDLGTVITAHQDISGKQDKLVSGTNIKTINGTSILGSGNITISGGSGSGSGNGAYSEVNHGTSDTTFALTPNTFHVWDEVASLTLDFGSETSGVANEFLFQFTSGATATSLTLPDDIKWTGGEIPAIEANKIYQISILKGLGSVLEWDNAPTLIENKATLTFDTITFQYPVASELTIKVGMGTVTISAGEKSCQIQYPEPGMEIMSISPISDSTYYYTF